MIDEKTENQFSRVRSVITAIRNLRSEHRLPPSQKVNAKIYGHNYTVKLEAAKPLIVSLRTGIGELTISESGERIDNALYTNIDGIEVYLEVEIDSAAEKARLEKEIEKITNGISGVEKKLANAEFVEKAPEALVAQEKNKLEEYRATLKKLQEAVDNFYKKYFARNKKTLRGFFCFRNAPHIFLKHVCRYDA